MVAFQVEFLKTLEDGVRLVPDLEKLEKVEQFKVNSLSIIQEEAFHSEGGDTLEQVAQGGCGCPIPEGIQGQAGCGSGQPGLMVGDPAHSRLG